MKTLTQVLCESFEADQGYYRSKVSLYLKMDSTSRKEYRDHWEKCHMKNLADNRLDLVIFSGKTLMAIDFAEAIIAEQQ